MYVMHDIGLFMIAFTGCGLAIYLVISGVQDIREARKARLERDGFYEAQTDALEAVLNATDEVRKARKLIQGETK